MDDYSPYSQHPMCRCVAAVIMPMEVELPQWLAKLVGADLGYPIRITGRIEKEGQ